MQMENRQYNTIKREKALKKYLSPYSLNIGLNPDSKQEERLVQPDEKDLAAAHHMNNNKLSRNKKKKGLQTIYCHVNWAAVVKLPLKNVYLSY